MKRKQLSLGAVILVLTLGMVAYGDISFSFSDMGLGLAADVTFAQDGENLVITLENTSTYDVLAPQQVLTGVFFDLATVTLTPVSVVLANGSFVLFPVSGDGTDSNGEIGGEYGFRDDLTGTSTAAMAVVAVGMDDIVGPGDLFPGEALWGPPSDAPNGLGYGIVSAGDDETAGNDKVTGSVPLVNNGVVFTLSGLPTGFDLDGSVSNISFNYGTGLNSIIPAPGALLLGMIGLGLARMAVRRIR